MKDEGWAAVLALGSFVLAGAAWEAVARSGLYPPHLFPPPTRVAAALGESIRSGELWLDLRVSAFRWSAGLALGVLIGIPLGLMTGRLRAAGQSAGHLLNFLRTIPFIVVIPLAMLWFGFGEKEKVFMVAWGAMFPVWLSTQVGAQQVPSEYLWAARSLGVSGPRLFATVVLPSCMPFVIAGTRIAIATSTFALTASEMTGAFEGLSYRVFYSYQMFQTEKMMAGILVLGILCFSIDRLFVFAMHRLMPWSREQHADD